MTEIRPIILRLPYDLYLKVIEYMDLVSLTCFSLSCKKFWTTYKTLGKAPPLYTCRIDRTDPDDLSFHHLHENLERWKGENLVYCYNCCKFTIPDRKRLGTGIDFLRSLNLHGQAYKLSMICNRCLGISTAPSANANSHSHVEDDAPKEGDYNSIGSGGIDDRHLLTSMDPQSPGNDEVFVPPFGVSEAGNLGYEPSLDADIMDPSLWFNEEEIALSHPLIQSGVGEDPL